MSRQSAPGKSGTKASSLAGRSSQSTTTAASRRIWPPVSSRRWARLSAASIRALDHGRAQQGCRARRSIEIRTFVPLLSNHYDGSNILAAASYTNFGEVNTQGIDLGVELRVPRGVAFHVHVLLVQLRRCGKRSRERKTCCFPMHRLTHSAWGWRTTVAGPARASTCGGSMLSDGPMASSWATSRRTRRLTSPRLIRSRPRSRWRRMSRTCSTTGTGKRSAGRSSSAARSSACNTTGSQRIGSRRCPRSPSRQRFEPEPGGTWIWSARREHRMIGRPWRFTARRRASTSCWIRPADAVARNDWELARALAEDRAPADSSSS